MQRMGAGFFAGGEIADEDFEAFGFGVELAGFACQDLSEHSAHFFAEFGVAAGFGGLALEGGELLFDFDENIVDAGKIELGGLELGFGEAALGLVHGDAGGFFDDGAAVHGLGVEDEADAALLDDGVGIGAEAHGHEEFGDVAEADRATVEEIFALAGAVQAAADDDFAGAHSDGVPLSSALLGAGTALGPGGGSEAALPCRSRRWR